MSVDGVLKSAKRWDLDREQRLMACGRQIGRGECMVQRMTHCFREGVELVIDRIGKYSPGKQHGVNELVPAQFARAS